MRKLFFQITLLDFTETNRVGERHMYTSKLQSKQWIGVSKSKNDKIKANFDTRYKRVR